MKLTYVEMVGFRGVREQVRVPVPDGFAVVCGPNGSGKSTICDALEFALTGSISRYSAKTEKGEHLKDYLWWRGGGRALDPHVSVGLNGDGPEMHVTRSPTGVEPGEGEVLSKLCEEAMAPRNALQYLCRSSILRDELIGELSLDLSETERFQIVRSTIGVFDFTDVEGRLDDARKELHERLVQAEEQYGEARKRSTDLIEELSETKARFGQAKDAEKAEALLRELLVAPEGDVPSLISDGRELMGQLRLKVDRLVELVSEVQGLERQERDLSAPDADRALDELKAALAARQADADRRVEDLAGIEEELKKAESQSPEIAALANLHQSGSTLGLRSGQCPLCGSEISEADFAEHLQTVNNAIEEHGSRVAATIGARDERRELVRQSQAEISRLRLQVGDLERQAASFAERWSRLRSQASGLGLDVDQSSSGVLEVARNAVERHRSDLQRLEEAIATLEASALLDRLVELERLIDKRKRETKVIEGRIAKLGSAESRAREALAFVRRVSGELVDERLAALSPLLKELYSRLRPHIDWPQVDYHIRGDVRRFLSLQVGDELNPAFMFSSGQRRAAGIAFLLAVFLTRSWSRLRTLVLDDPVQHIDDFRALHLVEVLTAIRRAGFQILCTVEDAAVADLLCRRLGSAGQGDGVRIDLEYVAGRGVSVMEVEQVGRLPEKALVSA